MTLVEPKKDIVLLLTFDIKLLHTKAWGLMQGSVYLHPAVIQSLLQIEIEGVLRFAF